MTTLIWGRIPPSHVQRLRIFDALIHGGQAKSVVHTPDQILTIPGHADVSQALVSSAPDDGTPKLYVQAPQRIIPFLRICRPCSRHRLTLTKLFPPLDLHRRL